MSETNKKKQISKFKMQKKKKKKKKKDWDSVCDLVAFHSNSDPRRMIDSKIKSSFTRTVNKTIFYIVYTFNFLCVCQV